MRTMQASCSMLTMQALDTCNDNLQLTIQALLGSNAQHMHSACSILHVLRNVRLTPLWLIRYACSLAHIASLTACHSCGCIPKQAPAEMQPDNNIIQQCSLSLQVLLDRCMLCPTSLSKQNSVACRWDLGFQGRICRTCYCQSCSLRDALTPLRVPKFV